MKLIFLFLLRLISALEKSVEEDDDFSLQCGNNEGIDIRSASWTNDLGAPSNYYWNLNWRNLVFPFAKTLGLCTYDVAEIVKSKCQGKDSCTFKANRSNLNNNCNYWMELNVEYQCLHCIQQPSRRKRMVADFVCDLTVVLPSINRFGSCPNNRFEVKHVSSRNQDSTTGASIFATQTEFVRNWGGTVSTNVHSVFITSNPMTYSQKGNNCVFNFRASKYDCYKQANFNWACTYIGPIIATHDMTTGHYLRLLDF